MTVASASWTLPAFWCPIGSPVHPSLAKIEAEALAWLDRTGLAPGKADRAWCVASHAAEFSARLGPHAPERLVLLFARWNYLKFAVDDARLDHGGPGDRTPDLVDFAFRALRTVESPGAGMLGGPAGAALADLAARTRRAVSPGQLQRIADGLRDCLLGVTWQARDSAHGVMPSLADYIAGRLSDVGGRFDAAFVEVLSGAEIPADIRYADAYRALTEAAGFIVACDNDLISYAKEMAMRAPGAPPPPNIITVMMQHASCDFPAAVTRAMALRDQVMDFFLRARETVVRGGDPGLRRYLRGLGHFIAGHLHWSDRAPRYACPRTGDELPPAVTSLGLTWRDGPAFRTAGPPGIPSIDWWWQIAPAATASPR